MNYFGSGDATTETPMDVTDRKKTLEERLVEVLDQKAKVLAEEKALKQEIGEIFDKNETVGRITRQVQVRFKEDDPLVEYLKDKGYWRSVVKRKESIVRKKIEAISETDDELRKLYENCLVESNRILYDSKK